MGNAIFTAPQIEYSGGAVSLINVVSARITTSSTQTEGTMTRRCLSVLMIATWIHLGLSTVAFAQDDGGMSFGVDEVEEPPAEEEASSPAADLLAEGRKLYEQKKYAEASLLFYKIIDAVNTGDVAAEAVLPEAEYELAKTLFRLQLYQGALTYYGRIVDAGETHPYYFGPALNGLLLLTDVIPSDRTLLARLAPYAAGFPQDVPKKYRDRYAYLVGRYLYSIGEYAKALELIDYIQPRDDNYIRARYIAAVTHVGNYDARQAVAAFKDVLRPLTQKLEEETLDDGERKLLEMAWMGMGRVFYSTGEYNKAIKYYSRIPRDSSLWPKSLFESSYAYFQLDLENKALGNLHTLNSPFFSRTFEPEAAILAGVIFFYNCKYPRVRYELEEFTYTYLPIKDNIEDVLTAYEDPAAMYEWLLTLRRGEAEGEQRLNRILRASLDDKEIDRKVALIEAIERELSTLEALPKTWTQSMLGGVLIQDATVAREFAVSELGELANQRLERVRDQLVDLDVERQRILFEVERAERGEVKSELRAEMDLEADVTDTQDIDVSDEQLTWTFDGEYWRDELGYYLFNINTECRR